MNIEYTISMPEPSNHLFEVEIKLEGINENENIELIMPAWRSGRYFIFDFSGGVQQFEAYDANAKSLLWHKTDKSTWRIENSSNGVIIKYKVYADEFSQRTRGLDSSHAFINGTAVLMYCEKYRKYPVTLNVIPYGDWHITTGLENMDNPNKFYAPNYDYLIDCPLEIGKQTDFNFDVEGKKHIISFFGESNFDKERLLKDFTKLIKENYRFWGSVPYNKYVFIVHCSPQSGGGTEHINSTVVGVRPEAFETEAGYTDFLRLISHEFLEC
jgi:predicted metalloprotease with PDZ domain